MENEKFSIEQLINEYRGDIQKLVRYIPWLEQKKGKEVSSTYDGNGIIESSISFPVYDGTLLSFVKEAKNTKLMNRNYHYIYSRYHMKNPKDEVALIQKATVKEFELLKGILSKYILLGMTKSCVWVEGIEHRIYLSVLLKMKEIIEHWDKPMT